jgi:hypothetical protein
VYQIVLLSPQLLIDTILGLDFLIDHAAEISFPDRKVSLKIIEEFFKFGISRRIGRHTTRGHRNGAKGTGTIFCA